MENENIWMMYFAGILALRFHPKNDGGLGTASDEQKVLYAAKIADLALTEHHRRWPVEED